MAASRQLVRCSDMSGVGPFWTSSDVRFHAAVGARADISARVAPFGLWVHGLELAATESHELGIDTTFWAETSPAQKVGVN